MTIISEIKVDGKWMNQDDVPEDIVAKIVKETISRAGMAVGFRITPRKEG